MRRGVVGVVVTVCAVGLGVAARLHAQAVQDTSKQDVVALIGCVEPASEVKAPPVAKGGTAVATPDWYLTHVTPAVITVTPPPPPRGASGATGATGDSGAAAPTPPPAETAPPPAPPAPTASTYALDVKDNMAKERLHMKVEVIGEPPQAAAPAGRGRGNAAAQQTPLLKVQSIALVSPTCP